MKKDYPLCIKVPDKQGNFTRVLKRCRSSLCSTCTKQKFNKSR